MVFKTPLKATRITRIAYAQAKEMGIATSSLPNPA